MARFTFNQKVLVGAAAALALIVVLVVVNRLATRSDRIEHERRVARLISVRDALLQYQYKTGQLPRTLHELVPRYLRVDQLSAEGKALYRYDPSRRTIALAKPSVVRGIVNGTIAAVSMDLPEPQGVDARTEPRPSDAVVGRAMPPALASAHDNPLDASLKTEARLQPSSDTLEKPKPQLPPPPPPPPPPKPAFVRPVGPKLSAPPAGTYVFEAELYSELNYGWEVHLDETSAGGAYIHSKEGIANGPGQISCLIADFYNIEEKPEYTSLKYHFNLPESGNYMIFGRFFTTGSHCSNCAIVGLDCECLVSKRMGDGIGGYNGHAIHNETPFRWVWTPVDVGARRIERGDHYLHLFLHEDGMRLDQIALTTSALQGDKAFTANLVPNEGTQFQQNSKTGCQLTFDLRSVVMTKDMPPEASLAVRTIRPLEGKGRIGVTLENAAPGGGTVELGAWELDLAELPELSFMPIDFSKIEFESLARREYLLVARLSSGKDELASVHVPMMHPLKWEVAGPLAYFVNGMPGPLDGTAEAENIDWKPLADTSWDHWGVIDFGVHADKPSLHAPPRVTAYARTRIHVPESGEYLLKIQSDDQMLLWIDDELVLRHDAGAPVTRSAARPKVKLEKGDHAVRMRVNNGAFTSFADGRWQANLRFRTLDDRLSNITGR